MNVNGKNSEGQLTKLTDVMEKSVEKSRKEKNMTKAQTQFEIPARCVFAGMRIE